MKGTPALEVSMRKLKLHERQKRQARLGESLMSHFLENAWDEDWQDNLADMITALRIYTHAIGGDFDRALRSSANHFQCEVIAPDDIEQMMRALPHERCKRKECRENEMCMAGDSACRAREARK